MNSRLIAIRKELENLATDPKAYDGRYQKLVQEEREAKLNPGFIVSSLSTVIDRQKAYKVYVPEEFDFNPYNTAYWSSHLIEEMCELADCALKDQPDEAADVIIFLQNLTAYLFPKETLSIDLYSYDEPRLFYLEEPISLIRKNLYNRKSWKVYPEVSFEAWLKVVTCIMEFILCYELPQSIIEAYRAKGEYNVTRTDWNRS